MGFFASFSLSALNVPAPSPAPLNIFAIWLTTRFVIAPACACVDPGMLGSGEKNDENRFRTGTHVALVNGTSRGRAISPWVYLCASVEILEEYLLSPLYTLEVRMACWMTAPASHDTEACGRPRGEDVHRVWEVRSQRDDG